MSTLSTPKPSRARAHRPAGPGVPWGTVTTLAVGLSCTSAFWLVSLAGAVGAPERYEHPFLTWVMLSVTLLPVYGAGVLAALMLAQHWFGPVLHGWGRTVTTALLILSAGTLFGVLAMAASGAYDYHLQLPYIAHPMQGMASCTGDCVPREQHAIFDLHVRGVVLVSQKLLLTNAVLVAWVVAMWGGRIKLTNRSWRDDDAVETGVEAPGSLANDARPLLVGVLAGAAVVNVAAGSGPVMVVLSVAQLVVAGLVLVRVRERAAMVAAGAISLLSLGMWLWARPLALPSVLACVLELGALLLVWALLRAGRLTRPGLSAHTRALVALSLVATVAVGFAATGPSWFDAFGVSSAQGSHAATE
jgi:hypothetical protein